MIDFTIKPADLILVRGSEFESRLIERITSSPYSHLAGVVKQNELIEAQGFRKTGYQGLDYYRGCADVYTCDSLTDEQRHEIVEYVSNQLGTRYDYPLLLWEACRYLLHFVFPWHEGHNRICSTLWSDAYQSVGVFLCPEVMYPSPGDLANSKLLRKVGSY